MFHQRSHEDCLVKPVKHPSEVMLWLGIITEGPELLCLLSRIMDQKQYKHVLENVLNSYLNDLDQNKGLYTIIYDNVM